MALESVKFSFVVIWALDETYLVAPLQVLLQQVVVLSFSTTFSSLSSSRGLRQMSVLPKPVMSAVPTMGYRVRVARAMCLRFPFACGLLSLLNQNKATLLSAPSLSRKTRGRNEDA